MTIARPFIAYPFVGRLLRPVFVVVTLGALLAGCVDVIPGTGPAPDLYNLTPKSTYPPNLPRVTKQLVVEEPLAAGGLDSARIALRPSLTELKYFAKARWVERAPKMIQTLLVESYENTGRIVAVGRQAIGLRSDYNLKSELREFQAEYRNGSAEPQIRVRLNVKIVKHPRLAIIASENFERTVQASSDSMPAIVAAFDVALGKVLRETVEWSLTIIANDKSK
jgi:cholesterol transport system auxiliary component